MHGSGMAQHSDQAQLDRTLADTAAATLLVQLLKLSSLIDRPMQDRAAQAHNLSLNEMRIILCLGRDGALAGHDITTQLAIPPMNISRALAVLHARGWIAPVADPANRRRKPVRLSAAGQSAYAAIHADVEAIALALTEGLNPSACLSMTGQAQKIIDRIEQWPFARTA